MFPYENEIQNLHSKSNSSKSETHLLSCLAILTEFKKLAFPSEMFPFENKLLHSKSSSWKSDPIKTHLKNDIKKHITFHFNNREITALAKANILDDNRHFLRVFLFRVQSNFS